MEIIADYIQHAAGDREVVSWDRPDGKTYYNVPVVYIRQVSEAEYRASSPNRRDIELHPDRRFFWEVSVD